MTRNTYLAAGIALAIFVLAALWWWPRPTPTIVQPVRVSVAPDPTIASASTGTPTIARGTASPGNTNQTPEGTVSAVPQLGNSIPSVWAETKESQSGGSAITALTANVRPAPPSVQEAMIDLDKTQRMIRDFNTLMGENPVGTNAEIMQAVMGGNSRQATLGPGEGQELNGKGELVDRWGTPYFFHQLSGSHMEIHSAGPDKIMGTDDDLILK